MAVLTLPMQLVQYLKDIRTNATEVLTDMSAELKKLAQVESDSVTRSTFIDACKLIEGSSEVRFLGWSPSRSKFMNMLQLDLEYISGVAKKVTDARKAIFGGISNGIVKVSKSHV